MIPGASTPGRDAIGQSPSTVIDGFASGVILTCNLSLIAGVALGTVQGVRFITGGAVTSRPRPKHGLAPGALIVVHVSKALLELVTGEMSEDAAIDYDNDLVLLI